MIGVYARISSAFWWINKNICEDADAIKPSFCACNQSENYVQVSVWGLNDGENVIVRVKNQNVQIAKKVFRGKDGTKELCLPKELCLYINVSSKSGEGQYKVKNFGKEIMKRDFNGKSFRSIKIGCKSQ